VLVVDDDVDTCEMLTFALKCAARKRKPALRFAEAFDSLNDWKPDVLLTDINMPGEDGYGLMNKLQKLNSERGARKFRQSL
jgi:CheY-like chemotaxis protein